MSVRRQCILVVVHDIIISQTKKKKNKNTVLVAKKNAVRSNEVERNLRKGIHNIHNTHFQKGLYAITWFFF